MAKGAVPARSLFLDTGVLIGIVSRRDVLHPRSAALLRRIGQREWSTVVTSDYVLAEAFNYAQRKLKARSAVEQLLDLAFGSEQRPPLVADILRVHGARYAEAADSLHRHFDRGLSFTDWTTVILMRDAGIRELATFDHGFRGLVDVAEA